MSRSSLYTTNNWLPGEYSQRRRTLADMVLALELYCSSALVNIHGDMV